jgi:hypothetical protein
MRYPPIAERKAGKMVNSAAQVKRLDKIVVGRSALAAETRVQTRR